MMHAGAYSRGSRQFAVDLHNGRGFTAAGTTVQLGVSQCSLYQFTQW